MTPCVFSTLVMMDMSNVVDLGGGGGGGGEWRGRESSKKV